MRYALMQFVVSVKTYNFDFDVAIIESLSENQFEGLNWRLLNQNLGKGFGVQE